MNFCPGNKRCGSWFGNTAHVCEAASVSENQALCLDSRTRGDQVASRLLIQGFLIIEEEAARCTGVPERCPHPVKRQLAQVSPVPWRSGALPPARCMRSPCGLGRDRRETRVTWSSHSTSPSLGSLRTHPVLFVCLVLRALGEPFLRLSLWQQNV